MSLETKKNLNEKTIEAIQDLIQANIDSSQGFTEAATEIEDATLAGLFTELGNQRRQNADVLQQHVQLTGERPRTDGSFLASMHRTWLDLRSKLSGGDSHVILSEAERGEDYIKGAYEDALKDTAGSAMNDVLMDQYTNVKAGHDRIRDLRDHYKNS
ncbi:MAG: PA2169 family four-helix-bundle protein [Pirellulaceae bacterium]|nr:PA2169 family four-helix-bundle protein [Pirellulaceae bacterium]